MYTLSPDKHTNAQCALYICIMYNVNVPIIPR